MTKGFRSVFLVLILMTGVPASLHAEESDAAGGILVWRLEAKTGVNEKDIDSISGIITAEVEKYSGRKIVSEADIQTLLKGEETRQKCGENSTSCIAEIGAAMGVPEVVSGDLGKLGELWVLNLRRINVRDASVAGRSSRQVEGTVEDVVAYIAGAAAELFGKAAPPLPGILAVNTRPAGAAVTANGREIGRSPVKKRVVEGKYSLLAVADGYLDARRQVEVKSGERTEVSLNLTEIRMNPYKKCGYAFFFTGVGLAAFGGVATWQASVAAGDNQAGDWGADGRSRAWSGLAITGYVLGGAAMAAGVILWALSPGDKEWAESHAVSAGVAPDGQGAVMSIGGRW